MLILIGLILISSMVLLEMILPASILIGLIPIELSTIGLILFVVSPKMLLLKKYMQDRQAFFGHSECEWVKMYFASFRLPVYMCPMFDLSGCGSVDRQLPLQPKPPTVSINPLTSLYNKQSDTYVNNSLTRQYWEKYLIESCP